MSAAAFEAAPSWLRAALRCPGCRSGVLEVAGGALRCAGCGAHHPQRDPEAIELMPPGWDATSRAAAWSRRQEEMDGAYAELAEDREHALLAWQSDYGPLGERLGRCEGRVLDVGGGNGIARHWLPPGTEYVDLEPSRAWRDQPWSSLSDVFPCLATPPCTLRGVAEALPVADATFDAALSIWSLNHVSDPEAALAETARVLCPGGRLLLVLEDVPPSWSDLLRGRVPGTRRQRAALALRKLASPAIGWPTQPDHLPLREAALRRAVRAWLTVEARAWSGSYLVLELRRR